MMPPPSGTSATAASTAASPLGRRRCRRRCRRGARAAGRQRVVGESGLVRCRSCRCCPVPQAARTQVAPSAPAPTSTDRRVEAPDPAARAGRSASGLVCTSVICWNPPVPLVRARRSRGVVHDIRRSPGAGSCATRNYPPSPARLIVLCMPYARRVCRRVDGRHRPLAPAAGSCERACVAAELPAAGSDCGLRAGAGRRGSAAGSRRAPLALAARATALAGPAGSPLRPSDRAAGTGRCGCPAPRPAPPACRWRPPGRPCGRPPGPMSISQSAVLITSRLCSMTITVLPLSTRPLSTSSSLRMSSKCRPVVGSSST